VWVLDNRAYIHARIQIKQMPTDVMYTHTHMHACKEADALRTHTHMHIRLECRRLLIQSQSHAKSQQQSESKRELGASVGFRV
jgi:hypothetical protein